MPDIPATCVCAQDWEEERWKVNKGAPASEETAVFKLEVEDGKGIWSDVHGDDGTMLTYESEDAARAALAERYPVLVQMEKYAGGKRTRVIRILKDEDDWPKRQDGR